MTTAPGDRRTFWRSPAGIALCVFLAVAALLLALEHRVHLLGVWPLLLVLVCLAMHVLLHRGHGGPGGDHPGRRHKQGDDDGR